MGQIIFDSCEFHDIKADVNPTRAAIASPCRDLARQKRYVACELRRMGDSLNARYYLANALYEVVRDFGMDNYSGALLTGLHSLLMLKNLLS